MQLDPRSLDDVASAVVDYSLRHQQLLGCKVKDTDSWRHDKTYQDLAHGVKKKLTKTQVYVPLH